MGKAADLTGRRFGRLVVTGEKTKKPHRHTMWKCICDCGKIKFIDHYNLVRGMTKSCGCLHSDIMSDREKIHGHSGSSLYRVWRNMHSRCENPNVPAYKNYGARGIKVCDRWHDAKNFFDDMEDGYSPSLELDRIDNNQGYCKDNCRWATPATNSRNRRNNVLVTMNGKTLIQEDWCNILGTDRHSFRKFLKKHRKDGDITIKGRDLDNTYLPKSDAIPSGCPWELTPDGNELQRRGSA